MTILCILFFLGLSACSQRHQENESHAFTNALVNESSPYLLQHAHNPVDWIPWSEKALSNAKEQDKLVIISIGYSSCHWCHVMEEESFENKEIASFMNDNFINIKVDREERPDVDMVYMTALQLMKGSGGWPLNVVTLPNGKPLYAGTYHTKEEWQEVLKQVRDFYRDNPVKANEYADKVAIGVQEANQIQATQNQDEIPKDIAKDIVNQWKPSWDGVHGGDQGQQKFMMPSNLDFLINYAALEKEGDAKTHLKKSLDKMALGGIYDQVGGGFFRYSTDEEWKYPHFEKMLYDNAQMISIYSKAFQIFKSPLYKEVVITTIDFLEREMKNEDGGYYAALNADTDGEEGKYYIWNQKEIEQTLGEDYSLFSSYYSLNVNAPEESGNFVLYRQVNDSIFSIRNKLTLKDLAVIKKRWNSFLLEKREERTTPDKDDKIITSWNALLINGYLDAYFAFGDVRYLERAIETFNFIDKNALDNLKLIHSYKEGGRKVEGFLEDYSFMVNALIKLYSATMDVAYLEKAEALHKRANKLFHDEVSGLYRYNQNNALISTLINTHDGVIPSPNAVMAENAFKLGHLLYDPKLILKSKNMSSTILSMANENPSGYGRWNNLLMNQTYPFYEIAVVGKNARAVLSSFQEVYLPNTLVVASPSESSLPLFLNRYVDEETYIYVCQNNTCNLPETVPEIVINQLKTY
ncbi:thioredoxin domain-containing protein [uncultured Cyclobacterium sp.]|uniref:thioredoxin domain-containing protein n=1 Tax=uncultured Cyclobacterium sp. TaxID=453820 RepID=UPI0030EBF786